ncbi:MAG: hypothetical protein ACYTGH_04115 [Planctomycetota bacterium]|jgi:hypothetical protein
MSHKKTHTLKTNHIALDDSWDVVVAGGGPAGWDGAPERPAPGFPDNGQWTVRQEGIRRNIFI